MPDLKKEAEKKQKEGVDRQDALTTLENRLQYLFVKEHYQGRWELFNAFKRKSVNAVVFKGLVETAANDTRAFLRKEIRSMKGAYSRGKDVVMLSDVQEGEPFSKMLIVIRDMYAPDIAHMISCEDTARIVVEKIFFHT